MSNLHKHLIGIVLLVLSAGYVWQNQQNNHDLIVSGRVTDKSGTLIDGAIIALESLPQSDIVFQTQSAKDGSFKLLDNFSPLLQSRNLYVTGPAPNNTINLLPPPFKDTPEWFPLRDVGQKIESYKGMNLNVGDIPIQVWYGKVKIHIQSANLRPLLIKKENWYRVWLRVRDHDQNVIVETTMSRDEVNKSVEELLSTVSIALPEGKWWIDVSLSGDDVEWLSSAKYASVAKGETADVYLICKGLRCLNK